MTETSKDRAALLDALEDVVERRLRPAESLHSEIATLLLGFPRDSVERPRVHRMLGIVYSQLNREADALAELEEARVLAASLSPPCYVELSNIARALSGLYAARGEDARAKDELVAALTFASIGGGPDEAIKLIEDVGHAELAARRFENSALLFGFLLAGNDSLKAPEHVTQSARIRLAQALNALGRHDEVHPHVKDSHATLSEDKRRLRFLTQLEAARASAGLGRHDEAEGALLMAENFLPENDTAIDHSEFIEAVTELQEVRAGEPAIESLAHLVKQYTEDNKPERIVVACRAWANAFLKRGDVPGALTALGRALKTAHQAKLAVAGDVRTQLLRRAGAGRLVDLSDTKSLMGKMEGDDLRFVQLGPLGRGSAGESVRAIDLDDGEQVSLRTLDLGSMEESQREAALSTERRAYATAATLHDPCLAKVRDMRLSPDGLLFTIQLYPEGPTLRQVYEEGADTARLLDLLARTVDALSVLHKRGLPHRALSPEHVILSRDDEGTVRPILVELGLAPLALPSGAAGSPGMPPYVAPEQVAGSDADTSADIYALGQMISEVWGGQVPVRANLGRLWKRDSEDQMPRAIGDLVRGMTAAEPDRRLADLNDIVEVLDVERGQTAPI
ncbi:MAG: hypothetical protein AAF405_08425, partial [Pseudomonadota bacterium]